MSAGVEPRIVHIVSHTHWDREWYLTFHQFRAKLTRVVRRVLDKLENEDEYRHFLMDGQSILLEDHVEIHPEDGPRIRALVAAGKLSLGPWYVLPDEFLVSAEATVRNLLVGHKVARSFGGVQRVGYMPDSFGHVAQMPQILRRAGIDSFVYTRGSGDEIEELGLEYRWRAPDGSEVLAVNQCGGYCNAGGLGLGEIWHAHTRREVDLDRAVEQVRELFRKMSRLSRGDVWLLNNGCDHFPPQRDFGRVLDALRKAFPRTEFRHTGLKEYVDAVHAAGVAGRSFEGELTRGKHHHILSGVWSARMPLKQRNDECQTLLADVLEPLAACTHFRAGREYPSGSIEYAWKLLMQNHPHDSICGCSVDEVHREMGPRFDGVVQTGEELLRQELEHLVPTFARRGEDDSETVLCVANPLPEERTEIVTRMVVLQPSDTEVGDLRLFDERSGQVPFEILDCRYVERFWGIDYRMELYADRQRRKFGVYEENFGARMLRDASERDRSDCYLTIRFPAALPALGHARFFLEDRGEVEKAPLRDEVTVGGDRLENDYYRVRVHPDGTLDVEDKLRGESYTGLNRLEDTEDVGDEYDYCAAPESRTVTSEGVRGTVRAVDAGSLRGVLEAEFALPLPESIRTDRRGRTDSAVDCRTRVRVGLTHDSPILDVEVLFDNRARDHRLRARFPTSIRTDTIVSDGQFMLNRRRIRQPGGEDWVQRPSGTYPQQDFSALHDERRGLAVLNRGLPEIAAEGATLVLTLLRAVEWLSRDDFESRRHSNAGPTLHTPDAQCPGMHRFHYAVVPFEGDPVEAGIKNLSRRWRTPPPAVQGVRDRSVPGGGSLLSVQGTRTCVSAIKKHETRDSLVVRLYNMTSEPVEALLEFGLDLRSAHRVDLLEERIGELPAGGPRRLTVPLAAHEIVTVEVELSGPGSSS